MREKLTRFMYGRYGGNDELSRFLLIAWVIMFVASMILERMSGIAGRIGSALNWITFIIVIWQHFRVLSRNIYARQRENAKFLQLKDKVTGLFHKNRDTAHYKYFKCPGCRQKVRVPKGRGHIEITCPRCRARFVKKS